MIEKIKDKIEKLLNLSMSCNEHEAKLALDKALKLMNKHNITKDEVYKQQMVSETFVLDVYRMPDWMVEIYHNMAFLSGCVFTWKNGTKNIYNKDLDLKAQARITGRERDVENSSYLISFLYRELENATNKYKIAVKKKYKGKNLTMAVKSFKKGMIETISLKLFEQQSQFFSSQEESGLICIDLETKIKDSQDFLNNILNDKIIRHSSKAKYVKEAYNQGIISADEIEINQAVSKQNVIQKIEL